MFALLWKSWTPLQYWVTTESVIWMQTGRVSCWEVLQLQSFKEACRTFSQLFICWLIAFPVLRNTLQGFVQNHFLTIKKSLTGEFRTPVLSGKRNCSKKFIFGNFSFACQLLKMYGFSSVRLELLNPYVKKKMKTWWASCQSINQKRMNWTQRNVLGKQKGGPPVHHNLYQSLIFMSTDIYRQDWSTLTGSAGNAWIWNKPWSC